MTCWEGRGGAVSARPIVQQMSTVLIPWLPPLPSPFPSPSTPLTPPLQVRLCSVVQRYNPDAHQRRNRSPSPSRLSPGMGGKRNASAQHRRELSLAMVLERARQRLKDARGGDVVVRPGLVAEAPVVRLQPVDVEVQEGAIAKFKIAASVSRPPGTGLKFKKIGARGMAGQGAGVGRGCSCCWAAA